jgi:hypothetical protein
MQAIQWMKDGAFNKWRWSQVDIHKQNKNRKGTST